MLSLRHEEVANGDGAPTPMKITPLPSTGRLDLVVTPDAPPRVARVAKLRRG